MKKWRQFAWIAQFAAISSLASGAVGRWPSTCCEEAPWSLANKRLARGLLLQSARYLSELRRTTHVDGQPFPGMFDHGDPGEVDQEISGGK
jgi:hypothetical protein